MRERCGHVEPMTRGTNDTWDQWHVEPMICGTFEPTPI